MPLTIVLAGFALTFTSLPNTFLTPAFVAGFVRVLIRHKPCNVKMPVFFTSFVAISAMLFKRSEQAFCFKPCSVASAFAKAPLVMAFAPAFIDFIDFIGAMLTKTGSEQAMERTAVDV